MKATYQQPTTEFLGMISTEMIATSIPQNLAEDGQNLNNAPTTDETSGNLSRYNVWNDED